MNKRMISLMAAALALLSASGQMSFTGDGEHPVIELTPDPNTGLDKIYVVYDIDGVTMSFNSSTGERPYWETYYFQNGHRVSEPVTDVRWNGVSTTLEKIKPNIGYVIQEGANPQFCCWVVNYADYYLELNDLFVVEDDPCEVLSFNIDGRGDAITYYTVNGYRRVLDRKIKLHYETLEFVGDSISGYQWDPVPVDTTFASLSERIEIEPPLCNTVFEMTGDQFLERWGLSLAFAETGSTYQTKAVDCRTTAEKQARDYVNELDSKNGLGGSAPITIVFTGYPTDAVDYRVWEMSTDQNFENVLQRDLVNQVTYTFDEYGTYYVRYTVTNLESQCNKYSEVYTIAVTDSDLKCPNVFSPGSTPDQNDVWQVTYKSLVEFHCWIYNRWGNLVYEYTDPGGGWDGYYRGKLVDPGVYYYVIRAKGGDGVSWNPRGAISILRYNGSSGTASDMEDY